jgi:hypothetical protein
MGGRPRRPTAVLRARGSFERHPERLRARSGEPKCIGSLGTPPTRLDSQEQELWMEIRELIPPGVAGQSDRFAFEELIVLYAKVRNGSAMLAEKKLLLQYLGKFGLTPSDRPKINISQTASDPLGDFLQRRKPQ